jgi:branched-chain amino acid transport system permease protein
MRMVDGLSHIIQKGRLLIPIIILLIIPLFVMDAYWLYVLTLGGIYALLASSWDLLAGYTGQVAFSRAAFFGIGAYVSALLTLNYGIPPWIGLLVGGIVTAMIGWGIGLPSIRLRGPYLSIATLGLAEIARLIILNEEKVTRGPLGLNVPPFPGVPKGALYYHLTNYYIFGIIFIISILIMYKIVNSNLGLIFKAIREDEDAAQASGIDATKYKLLAFVISSFFAGLAGAFYGHYIGLISPDMMTLIVTFTVIAMTIFGGLGTLVGPILAAYGLTIINEYLRVIEEYRLVIYGVALFIAILFMPEGFIGLIKKRRKGLRVISLKRR